MSYLIEFQRQQKALRDAEKERKKNASSMLNKYRGSEQDIKNESQLKAIKDADRDNKKKASSMLNQYRGTEQDIKNESQLKAIKDADRDNKKRASLMLNQYKGGEHDLKNDTQLKALKDADRDNKKKASESLHNYRGGEHDLKGDTQLKALKDADRDNKKKASESLHKYKGGEHDVKEYERAVIAEQKRTREIRAAFVAGETKSVTEGSLAERSAEVEALSTALEETEIVEVLDQSVSNVSVSNVSEDADILEPADGKPRRRGSKSEKSKAREKYEQHLSDSPGSMGKKKKAVAAKSRKALSVEFSFGIILPDDEPYPDVELCEGAASVIVPHVISQWTNETNIFCNPKAPKVSEDIAEDDWYDGEDDMRYKVKGKVPVQVFAESSAKEVSEGLGKVLKRRVSYRPVYEGEKLSAQDTIIGDGDQKWIRVRDGRLGGLGITF